MATLKSKGAALGALGGGAVSGIVNVGLYFVGKAMGATYVPKDPAAMKEMMGVESLPAFQPFVSSFGAGLISAIIVALLGKFAPNKGFAVYGVIAAIVFVVELAFPPMQFADAANIAILEIMHVPATVLIVGGVWWFGVRKPA